MVYGRTRNAIKIFGFHSKILSGWIISASFSSALKFRGLVFLLCFSSFISWFAPSVSGQPNNSPSICSPDRPPVSLPETSWTIPLQNPTSGTFFLMNKVHYQSGKCTFQMETENAFDLWELISRSTNKIVSVHFTFSTRNSSQFPPIRTGRLLSQNDLSGKDQSSIANLYIRGILGCHHLLSTLECV